MMFNITNKRAVGIDIADRTIEIAEIEGNKRSSQILSLSKVNFNAGIVERGRIKDEKKLIELINKALETAKPRPIKTKRIIYALPESVAFSFCTDLKGVDNKEIDSVLLEKVKKNVPLPEQDLIFDYKIINESKEEKKVLIVATDRQVVDEWKNFFKGLNIRVDYFDIEILASFRGIMRKPTKELVCLVDIGSVSTNVAIFSERGLQHSFLIPIAGESFSQDLASQLKIDLTNAETKKKQADLKTGDRYANVLIKSLTPIKDEVKKSIDFFQKKMDQKIKKVILIGGSSKIKGLADYFKVNLEIDTVVGKLDLKKADVNLKKIGKSFYLNAVGSALRDIDNRWDNDPIIEIRERKVEEKKKVEKLPTDNRVKKQLIALVSILIIGTLLIFLAIWYRNKGRQVTEEIKKTVQIDTYQDRQVLNFKIPVAVNITEYTEDRLQGRLIEELIRGAGGDINSRSKAEQRLKDGEKLWPVALNKIYKKEHEAFINTYRWMAYPENEMRSFFLREVDEYNEDDVKYILNGIKETTLEATDNPDIFIMGANVDVSFE